MPKERYENLKVGDRLKDGARVLRIDAKADALAVVWDLPERIEATKSALKAYAAVRRDQFGPWTAQEMESRRRREKILIENMHLPLDSSI